MEETAPAALPDDLVMEVLVRVADVAALLRCAMACKRWHGLIMDRSFLRRRWPDNVSHPSFLVGFFTQIRWCHRSEDDDEYDHPIAQNVVDPDSPPVFIPAPRSVLGRGLRLPSVGLLHGATTLTARRGLLLVRLARVDFGGPLRLAVCDLLAGTCDVLPPLQCDHENSHTSYAVLTSEDCRSSDGQKPRSPSVPEYSAFFKVVTVVLADDGYGGLEYNMHVFSSVEPGWSTPPKLTRTAFWPYVQQDVAVCSRGLAHWLSGDGYPDESNSNILTIDTISEDGRASLMELSSAVIEPDRNFHLTTIDGTLCLFTLRTENEDLRLEIWAWRDGGTDLYRSKVMELKSPENKPLDKASCWWSGEKSATLLIRDPSPCIYVIAYLQTGEMEEISSQFRGMVGNVVPIEMDWPSLFMSRLVGGSY